MQAVVYGANENGFFLWELSFYIRGVYGQKSVLKNPAEGKNQKKKVLKKASRAYIGKKGSLCPAD